MCKQSKKYILSIDLGVWKKGDITDAALPYDYTCLADGTPLV